MTITPSLLDYTACPNPWLGDFVEHYGKPYDPAQSYSREPLAIDVSVGKTDQIYRAHAYHTKMPHLAIAPSVLHYTEPGDIVLDGFAGSGITGVAAQWCGCAPPVYRAQIETEWRRRSPLAGDDPRQGMPVARKQAPTGIGAHGCDLRKGRWSETGRVYLITTVTERRRPVFRDFWCARLVVQELRAADALEWSTTWAFVVMPDHLHWLVELGGADLSRLVLRVKSRSAITVNRALGRSGRLWQKSFHDHALRKDEDLRATARYVVVNPVRAGLVTSVRDYPHWDARWV